MPKETEVSKFISQIMLKISDAKVKGSLENLRKNLGKEIMRQDLIDGLRFNFIDDNILVGDEISDVVISRIQNARIYSERHIVELFELDPKKAFLVENMTGEKLSKEINLVKSQDVILVGIGGGRVMDYVKYIKLKTGKFCVAVPSSLTTHVYASPKITMLPALKELGEKSTIDCLVPEIILVDTSVLSDLQKKNSRLITAGLGDIMACATAIPDCAVKDHK